MIDPNDIVKSMQLDSLTAAEQMQLLAGVEKSIKNSRVQRKEMVKGNVDVVIGALKKIESDIRSRYDDVGNQLNAHFKTVVAGKDGKDGPRGPAGQAGRDGANGINGRDGVDGRNGVDGQDGVSVTDAKIDFDGSLVITLSTGREINVGEVVAPDLAEKIKVITNGGGTSQQVLDAIAALQATIATYGTMALQNANAVAITGGTINNTVIGGATPAAGTFTTLGVTTSVNASGAGTDVDLNLNAKGSGNVRITPQSTSAVGLVIGAPSGSTANAGRLFFDSSAGVSAIANIGGNQLSFRTAATIGSSTGSEQARIAHTASAVNYVQVTGAATGGAGTISSRGSDANIGIDLITKGIGSVKINNAGGTVAEFNDGGAANPTNSFLFAAGGGGIRALIRAIGGPMTLLSSGVNSVNFATNGSSGNIQAAVSHTASAVNFVQVTGAATGGRPIISAQGSDSNISVGYDAKGTGGHNFKANGNTQVLINNTTLAVNSLNLTGSAAGQAVPISVTGSDTNIDLALTPKGTGLVRFGTYTADMTLIVQGYIEVKDSGGTIRKLAVIA